MLKADFHIHSTISDGSENIDRIIADALGKKLFAIAITTMIHWLMQNSSCKFRVNSLAVGNFCL
jgi:predicted metal-dependent phosphoesterase TrpH